MKDLLATYIWQVTVIHSLDHAAMYEFYRRMLTFTSMTPFFVPTGLLYNVWHQIGIYYIKKCNVDVEIRLSVVVRVGAQTYHIKAEALEI